MKYNSIFDTKILDDPDVSVQVGNETVTLTISKQFTATEVTTGYEQLVTKTKTLVYTRDRGGRIKVEDITDGKNKKRILFEGNHVDAEKFFVKALKEAKAAKNLMRNDNTQAALDFLNS